MVEGFQRFSAFEYDVVLASQSPRRRELLEKLGLQFEVMPVDVEESFPAHLKGGEIVEYLAKKKADAFDIAPKQMVITADTIVWHRNTLYGKPSDECEARRMLASLSGSVHEVFTGVGITTCSKQRIFSVRTEVKFAMLTPSEIDYYVQTYCPLDKAGAYGIQEWIGYVGVESISGSFWNVMGLPIQRLYQELSMF